MYEIYKKYVFFGSTGEKFVHESIIGSKVGFICTFSDLFSDLLSVNLESLRLALFINCYLFKTIIVTKIVAQI